MFWLTVKKEDLDKMMEMDGIRIYPYKTVEINTIDGVIEHYSVPYYVYEMLMEDLEEFHLRTVTGNEK